MTWDDVRRILSAFGGCEEGTSYRTPAFRCRRKFLCRMREDGETLVVKLDADEKLALLQSDSPLYFTTAHYDGHPSVLVRLPLIEEAELAELLELAYLISSNTTRPPRS